MTVERPSINGGYQTYTREESVETRQADASARIETVRKVDNGGGRLIESGREETVMSQSGDTATTEKIVWERDGLTSKMVEASKTVGTLITRADGSSTEMVETYAHSLATARGRFLNSTRPELVRTVTRETTIGSSGETIEPATPAAGIQRTTEKWRRQGWSRKSGVPARMARRSKPTSTNKPSAVECGQLKRSSNRSRSRFPRSSERAPIDLPS